MSRKTLLLLSEYGSDENKTLKSDIFAEFQVVAAHDLKAAYAAVDSNSADCVLVDGEIAGLDPIEILETLHHSKPGLPVVFYSQKMTAGLAIRLIRAGAYHCYSISESLDDLRDTLQSAADEKILRERSQKVTKDSREPWRAHLVGESRAMELVAETIRLVGKRRCTVLISGETGTGKEMAARALHAASQRGQHPMVAVNCSALPENLLEAELFGHTRGAFTGATSLRIGRFEQANKGTIFLDEIGEMPIDLQAKLLRVLQEREIQRLGSSETLKIDVRVIAATNVDLQERVRQGKFRQDLYYRLNVVPLQMPPLRKRISDIPALVNHFVQKICAMEDIPVKQVTRDAMSRLCAQQWQGNVRQLENTVEMAIAVSGDNETLSSRDFGLTSGNLRAVTFDTPADAGFQPAVFAPEEGLDFDTAVSRFELSILDSALRQTGGNKTAAAERLGIKRTTLIMKMRSFENSGLMLQRAS